MSPDLPTVSARHSRLSDFPVVPAQSWAHTLQNDLQAWHRDPTRAPPPPQPSCPHKGPGSHLEGASWSSGPVLQLRWVPGEGSSWVVSFSAVPVESGLKSQCKEPFPEETGDFQGGSTAGPEGHCSWADPGLCPGSISSFPLSIPSSMQQLFIEHLLCTGDCVGSWD